MVKINKNAHSLHIHRHDSYLPTPQWWGQCLGSTAGLDLPQADKGERKPGPGAASHIRPSSESLALIGREATVGIAAAVVIVGKRGSCSGPGNRRYEL